MVSPRQILTCGAVGAVILLADPSLPTYAAGCALAAVGIAFRVWACGHLRKNQELVTAGPYAHVQHPLYLGTFLIATGAILAAGSPRMPGVLVWTVVGPAFFASFFGYYLPKKRRVESDRLARRFGSAFERFDQSVPAFVPSWRAFPAASKGHWSWANLRGNHELGMDLLVVGLFCAMFLWGARG